ncbi:ATP-binding protein [Breoghania sp. L-A4]|uniref:ATP-binding protein n=1 Tax=Breoghania sp. L-A4 TaxID=2304600 RepID=UPI000E35CCF7|nr:ATP-binding protein [Breoghania sp. L-A4]AXS41444.1 HAMP domain-containing protein [Breoghania sp. L-A4]
MIATIGHRISTALQVSTAPLRAPYRAAAGWLRRWAPKSLYPRTILIIVLPMVLLQSVLAFMFMERHWETVTRRLSTAMAREISALITVIETYPQDADFEKITAIASDKLGLSISLLPPASLPAPRPKPFFDLLDRTLSGEIGRYVGKPFWIDTIGRSQFVEIRVKLDNHNMRIIARRSQTYASNSHIFLVWMIITSLVLITVALLFLRNQIRPIIRLADAAESFGKGHPIGNFQPRGAREVRRAAYAFIEMRRRIERQIEQRTTMLAGVSHDLRTILTRFRLQLALLGTGPEIDELRRDVDEMNTMLQAYLAFARGDGDEQPDSVDIALLIEDLEADAETAGRRASSSFDGDPMVTVKPNAFRRCLTNLTGNAVRYAKSMRITGKHSGGWLTVTIDDDGEGIPASDRETVFRPFFRLDAARNQDEGGTGLGLSIARDIARGHGGDITLSDSPMGGLRVMVRIPD